MLSPLTHDDPVEIAGHRLLARLGHGGMGTVYLARTADGRVLALKTMHAAIAMDPAARTRFHLETDAARIIGNHHGATVIDADPTAETPWLATEYVLGPPLDDAVDLCGPLPETSVRAIGAALAGALTQLHASDVVHRDLKPSNVMITAYGPKIIDFGIARAAGDDRLTRTGTAAGTPAYMSPEQATGQEHTPAGDVFALAGVLVYAATGHPPFGTGQAADLLYRVRYTEPDLTGLPHTLTPILTRCLAKDPTHRPTTHELAAQLHGGHGQFADHLPYTLLTHIAQRATQVWQYHPSRLSRPTQHATSETVTTKPVMNRRTMLALSGGTAFAAAGLGAGIWSWLSDPSKADSAPGTHPDADPDVAPPPAAPTPTAPADKRRTWIKGVRNTGQVRAPLLIGESVLVMTDDGLLSLGVLTGERRWLAPAVKGDVHADRDQVYALVPGEKGTQRISLQSVDSVSGLITEIPMSGFGRPLQEAALLTTGGSVAYLAARRGSPEDSDAVKARSWSATAVDLHTGTEKWSSPIRAYERDSTHALSSVVAGNRLVLCRTARDEGLEVTALDTRTGKRIWHSTLPQSSPSEAPTRLHADEQRVYVSGDQVQAFRLTDGAAAWSFGGGRGVQSYGVPVLSGGTVYATHSAGVVALSADTGSLHWEAHIKRGADLRVPPVIDREYVFVMAEDGVRAVSIRKRGEVWSSNLASPTLIGHTKTKRLIQVDRGQVFAVRYDVSF